MEIKKTPLHNKHIESKAKMIDFSGWNMPVYYSKISDEHLNVRDKVGLFDISHMGIFSFKGDNVLAFLQYLVPNDLSNIHIGKAIYTQLCNESGGVLDDLIIYHLSENHYLMVVNCSNVEKDWAWVNKHNNFDVVIENYFDKYRLMALQGPLSEKVLQSLCSINLSDLKSFHLDSLKLTNGISVIISRTGYTGEDGFEVFVNPNDMEVLWDALLMSGENFGIKPIGLGARDTLRLEASFPLYGNELNEETSPLEARLGWSVKLNKNIDFIGKKFLQIQKEDGVKKKLIGLKMNSRITPRTGFEVKDGEEIIGKVTSGTFSPKYNYPICLSYVITKSEYKVGDILNINVRGKNHPAEIVKLPFYKRKK